MNFGMTIMLSLFTGITYILARPVAASGVRKVFLVQDRRDLGIAQPTLRAGHDVPVGRLEGASPSEAAMGKHWCTRDGRGRTGAREMGEVERDTGSLADRGDALAFVRQHHEMILEIAARRGASDVRVFGSIARGDATETSDIDFLVRFEATASLWDRGGMWSELHELLGRHIDIADEASLRDELRDEVLREAIAI
jgi:uncharacterized protein